MNVIQASLDWNSAPGSGGTISMPAASAGVRSPMPACGLKKLWYVIIKLTTDGQALTIIHGIGVRGEDTLL